MTTETPDGRRWPCRIWTDGEWACFNRWPGQDASYLVAVPHGWVLHPDPKHGVVLLSRLLLSSFGKMLAAGEALALAKLGTEGFRMIEASPADVPLGLALPPAAVDPANPPLRLDLQRRRMTRCQADEEEPCDWQHCPQVRDGEPKATGRHCPLDVEEHDHAH